MDQDNETEQKPYVIGKSRYGGEDIETEHNRVFAVTYTVGRCVIAKSLGEAWDKVCEQHRERADEVAEYLGEIMLGSDHLKDCFRIEEITDGTLTVPASGFNYEYNCDAEYVIARLEHEEKQGLPFGSNIEAE
jgi:hypothetical protein